MVDESKVANILGRPELQGVRHRPTLPCYYNISLFARTTSTRLPHPRLRRAQVTAADVRLALTKTNNHAGKAAKLLIAEQRRAHHEARSAQSCLRCADGGEHAPRLRQLLNVGILQVRELIASPRDNFTLASPHERTESWLAANTPPRGVVPLAPPSVASRSSSVATSGPSAVPSPADVPRHDAVPP